MSDPFDAYETGLARLLTRLDEGHPRYTEALTLQSRLQENIVQSRRYGDTESRRAERAQIVNALNRLALRVLGVSFNDLCRAESLPASERDVAIAKTAGERGVTVGGDVRDSVIITGNGVTVHLGGSSTPSPAADREGLERALRMARRALYILEEQAAGFGPLHVPVHLRIELEEKRKEVARLEAQLRALEE